MSRAVPILFVLACMPIAIWLYPFDSDAAFAVHDAIWYAVGAERFPGGSVNPHHPLFHAFVIGFMWLLKQFGVSGPGHVATRIVAGLGGSWLLVQICALAGRRRVLVGAAFALALFCSRGFLVEMAAGENVLPAAAAALLALRLASRPNPNLFATGAALTFAGLLRQDNVFTAAGVAAGLLMGLPKGRRIRGILVFGFWVLLATAAGYLIAWQVNCDGREPFFDWMRRFGRQGPWTGPQGFELGRFSVYLFTIALEMTGRIAPGSWDSPWIGIGYLAWVLVPALMLRGSEPRLRLGLAILVTLIPRAFFHTWFEAENYEWLVLPVSFVVAFGAGFANGEAATGLAWRRTGIVLLLLLAGWLLAAHGKYTVQLRERRLMTAINQAVDVDRTKWRFLAHGARVGEGLYLIGIEGRKEGEPPFGRYEDISPRGTDMDDTLRQVQEQITRFPVPTVVVADRFVMDGMPFTLKHWKEWAWFFDTELWKDPPNWKLLRYDGLGYAARYIPPAPETRAESSK